MFYPFSFNVKYSLWKCRIKLLPFGETFLLTNFSHILLYSYNSPRLVKQAYRDVMHHDFFFFKKSNNSKSVISVFFQMIH